MCIRDRPPEAYVQAVREARLAVRRGDPAVARYIADLRAFMLAPSSPRGPLDVEKCHRVDSVTFGLGSQDLADHDPVQSGGRMLEDAFGAARRADYMQWQFRVPERTEAGPGLLELDVEGAGLAREFELRFNDQTLGAFQTLSGGSRFLLRVEVPARVDRVTVDFRGGRSDYALIRDAALHLPAEAQ